MLRHIHWSDRARTDLKGIIQYISRENKQAASAFLKYITKAADDLGTMPIGRCGELPGTYERILSRYPSYMIIYSMDEAAIYIVRIFHASQNSKL